MHDADDCLVLAVVLFDIVVQCLDSHLDQAQQVSFVSKDEDFLSL